MDEEEVTDIEVEKITIKGKKYFIDRNNVVYSYAEDLSVGELPQLVGELVDGELQEYVNYDEIDENLFEDENQYYEISKLNLYLNFYKDQDYDIFEIAYYNKEEDEYITISGIQRKGQRLNDEKIEDVEEILFPLSYDIKHSSDVVLPIEANFYVGYYGVEDKGFLSYFVFWNGTINIGDNVEEVDTDLDLSVPVGNYLVKIDDDVDIDEFDFEERKNILIRSAMLSKNSKKKHYTIKYEEGRDVNKIIYDNFILQQEEQSKRATVTIPLSNKKEKKAIKSKPSVTELKSVAFEMKPSATKMKPSATEMKPSATEMKPSVIVDEKPETFGFPSGPIKKRPKTKEQIINEIKKLAELYKTFQEQYKSNKTKENKELVVKSKLALDIKKDELIALSEKEQMAKQDINIRPTEEELKQIRKKYKRLFDEYQIAKGDNTIDKNELKQMKDTLISEKKKIQKLKSELETKGTGINNPELYEKAKQIADEKYKKPSAYKSGFIVKKYKELGGTYSGTKNDNEGIGRWFKEDWKDIVPLFKKGEKNNFGSTFSKGREEYPVYRPTKRITKDTPLTPQQIKPSNLKKQIALKQEIKGDANLPPFQGKGLDDYSNPKVVYQKARKYLGKDVIIQPSTNKNKKYMVYDPNTENWVHFGTMKPPMEDFTKHQDEKRRQRYLARATKIKGDWKDNKYSANNLSINILW